MRKLVGQKQSGRLPSRSVQLASLFIIVAAGAWLRFHNLSVDSLWLDEAVSWQQSKDSFVDLVRRTAEDTYPPLNNLFIYASISLFGDREWALRLPSAILGTANILALYWLGSMTVGRAPALIAAAFLALSGFHVWYSQEARMYALLSLTATLFVASSFYFVRSPTFSRASLVSLSGMALLYSHAFGTFNWIAIVVAISFFTHSDHHRTAINRYWVASNVAAAICFAPWAWLLKRKATELSGVGFWTPYPSPEVVYNEMNGMLGGRLMEALISVGVMLALVPTKRIVNGERRSTLATSVPILLVWAGLPMALAYVISLISTPIFISRYLIGSLPALLLVAAYGLTRFAKGRARIGLTVLSGAILITSFVRYVTAPREDWRGVAAMFNEQLQSSDCVLVHGPMVPLNYYYRKNISCLLSPEGSEAQPYLQNISINRLFVISSHRPLFKTEMILEELRSDRWSTRREFQFHGVRVLELGK